MYIHEEYGLRSLYSYSQLETDWAFSILPFYLSESILEKCQ